ncbi:MAG: ECF transporter S component [Bacilli bacterium]|nr:ECF transporter S component [Bacilli bacterium]
MNKKITTRQIVITGLMLALMIVLQIVGNYLQFGPVNINISLVAVVLAAVLGGPLSGAIVGFFNGIMALLSPSTIAVFMPVSLVGTILACLLKCTLAGLVSGLAFNAIKKKNTILALIIASLLVPIINTGIFIIMALIFFRPILEANVTSGAFPNIWVFLLAGFIGWNFLIELLSTGVISPIVGGVVLRNEK